MNRIYKVVWSKAKNCYTVFLRLRKDMEKETVHVHALPLF